MVNFVNSFATVHGSRYTSTAQILTTTDYSTGWQYSTGLFCKPALLTHCSDTVSMLPDFRMHQRDTSSRERVNSFNFTLT